ncbi:MAG: chromate efflux transporter [Blastocatellia bacterium]|nr:chromate efflux transporter [Blastocatellia bacterium]
MNQTGRDESSRSATSQASLRQLAWVFLKLGAVAFGGPAAHIAMMEDEVVRRRRWLPRDEFLDLLGATNLIPGPNSTELAIHVGHRKAAWTGLLVAGSCFILPAAFIVIALAWAYVRYGSLPQTNAILYGVKPVIIAIILQALWRLATTALKTRSSALIGAAGMALGFLGANELAIIFGGGIVACFGKSLMKLRRRGGHHFLSQNGQNRQNRQNGRGGPLALFANMTTTAGASAASFGLWPLFLFFLKVGSVLFGSGYVLLAFLRADLVERWHWLTEEQLLDAIAVGQVTPGPVFTTATFIGYVLGGYSGAIVATTGIFLPAFFFVAVSGPLVPLIRRSETAGAFLDGVNAASLSLMAVVTWQIGRAALGDWLTVALLISSLILLTRYHLNSSWLALGGAVTGLLLHGRL